MKRRPSPAMLVALVALFVALGGTSYAAIKLPKNSVDTKQVKNKAITTKKLKPGAVTNKQIRKGTISANRLKPGVVPVTEDVTTRTVRASTMTTKVSGPGICSSGTGLPSEPADHYRVIFYTATMKRTEAGTGPSEFTFEAGALKEVVQVDGVGTEKRHGSTVVAPGESSSLGINVKGNNCDGTAGEMSMDYVIMEAENAPFELPDDL